MYKLWCTYYDIPLSDVTDQQVNDCALDGAFCADCIYVEEFYDDEDDDIE